MSTDGADGAPTWPTGSFCRGPASLPHHLLHPPVHSTALPLSVHIGSKNEFRMTGRPAGMQRKPATLLLHVRHPHPAAVVCMLHRQRSAGLRGHSLRDVLP